MCAQFWPAHTNAPVQSRVLSGWGQAGTGDTTLRTHHRAGCCCPQGSGQCHVTVTVTREGFSVWVFCCIALGFQRTHLSLYLVILIAVVCSAVIFLVIFLIICIRKPKDGEWNVLETLNVLCMPSLVLPLRALGAGWYCACGYLQQLWHLYHTGTPSKCAWVKIGGRRSKEAEKPLSPQGKPVVAVGEAPLGAPPLREGLEPWRSSVCSAPPRAGSRGDLSLCPPLAILQCSASPPRCPLLCHDYWGTIVSLWSSQTSHGSQTYLLDSVCWSDLSRYLVAS